MFKYHYCICQSSSGDTKKLSSTPMRASPKPRRRSQARMSSSETALPDSGDVSDASVSHTSEKEGKEVLYCCVWSCHFLYEYFVQYSTLF